VVEWASQQHNGLRSLRRDVAPNGNASAHRPVTGEQRRRGDSPTPPVWRELHFDYAIVRESPREHPPVATDHLRCLATEEAAHRFLVEAVAWRWWAGLATDLNRAFLACHKTTERELRSSVRWVDRTPPTTLRHRGEK
jgi:hypothetical protein